jgi:hypothetical protein
VQALRGAIQDEFAVSVERLRGRGSRVFTNTQGLQTMKNIQRDIAETPTVKAALKTLADNNRRFLLLVWDDDTSDAAVLANAHPKEILHMMMQTGEAIIAAHSRGEAEQFVVDPTPTH